MRAIPFALIVLLAAAPVLAAAPSTASHPGGTVVTVNAVTHEAAVIVVDAILANEGTRPVRPNQSSGAVLLDARGGRYPLIPPAGNRELTITPHSRLETTLRFQGPVNAGSGALRMVFNEVAGEASDPATETPRLAIDLPQPEAAPVAMAAPTPAKDSDSAAIARLRNVLGARQMAEGLLVTLGGDVLFQFGKADILASAEPTLCQLADLIGMTDPKTVIVTGHTDAIGPKSTNVDLSLQRAVAVSIWLEKVGGVSGPKLEKRGYGEKMAVAWNQHRDGRDNPEGRRQNRRVEVTLVAAGDPPGTQ